MLSDTAVLLVSRFLPNSKWRENLVTDDREADIIVVRNTIYLYGYRVSPFYLLWEFCESGSAINSSCFLTAYMGEHTDKNLVEQQNAYRAIGLSLLVDLKMREHLKEVLSPESLIKESK